MTTAAVPMAAVEAVVGDNCNNGKDGSGVDGGGDDSGCGDGECNGGSSGDGHSKGSGKAKETKAVQQKSTAATAMAGGGKYNNKLKRGQLKEQWQWKPLTS